MKTAKYIVIIIGIGIIGFLLYAVTHVPESDPDVFSSSGDETQEEFLPPQMFKDSIGNEVSVVFSPDVAIVTKDSPEDALTLTRAISGSGARYTNEDESVVLWNKGDDITLYEDDKIIFEGTLVSESDIQDPEEARVQKNNLIGTWKWTNTILNSNDTRDIQPKSTAFSLTFTEDMKVSGTTDCNNFMGSYEIEGDRISFGPLASTLMFCENSQESDFLGLLGTASSYFVSPDGSLVLVLANNTGSLVFMPEGDGNPTVAEDEETFTGILEEVNTGCFVDAECYIVVDGKHVTAIRGWSQDTVGTIIGVDGFGDLESKKGEQIEVYAQKIDDDAYTLYGSLDYYIKAL